MSGTCPVSAWRGVMLPSTAHDVTLSNAQTCETKQPARGKAATEIHDGVNIAF